jgi:N-acetylmuramoyl-L-alanine amidase
LAAQPTGRDVIAIASEHINAGEQYILGSLVPKNNPHWKGPWDSAEFVCWCIYQVSNRLFGCDYDYGNPVTAESFSGYWQRDGQLHGNIVSVEEAARTPGAVVLRFPPPDTGKFGHIVISDGAGGTLEAKDPSAGLVRDRLEGRRWDVGLLVPFIQYTPEAAVSVSMPPVFRLTSPNMRDNKIREIQQGLKDAGFDPGGIDGVYRPMTMAAVTAYQITKGMVPDGEAGRETAEALGVAWP